MPKVCAQTRTRTHTLVLYLPLLKPSMAMTRPRTEVGHSLPPPSSACCQLSVSSSLDLQTDYSGRHVVASDPKALPGSQAQRPGQPCPRRTRVREGVLSVTWHHTCHQCPLVSHRIQGTHCRIEAVIRCRHDSAARSPSACCAALPQLMLVTVSDISRSHP